MITKGFGDCTEAELPVKGASDFASTVMSMLELGSKPGNAGMKAYAVDGIQWKRVHGGGHVAGGVMNLDRPPCAPQTQKNPMDRMLTLQLEALSSRFYSG